MPEPKIDPKTLIRLPLRLIRKSGRSYKALVYAMLTLLQNEKGIIEMPIQPISEQCKISANTVRIAIQQLREGGFLQVIPKLSPKNPTSFHQYRLVPLEEETALIPAEALFAELPLNAFIVYCYTLWFYQKHGCLPLIPEVSYGISLTSAYTSCWMRHLEEQQLPLVTGDGLMHPYLKTAKDREREKAFQHAKYEK